MSKHFLFFFLFLALFLGIADATLAVALKVTPAEIEISAVSGVIAQSKISVENIEADVALYQVFVDNFSDIITITPASFILESGEVKEVIIKIKSDSQGVFATNLSVVAKPVAPTGFTANSGVKISLQIKILEWQGNDFTASIARFFSSSIAVKWFVLFLLTLIIALLWIILPLRKKMLR